jgi:type II secretory pathway component PulF
MRPVSDAALAVTYQQLSLLLASGTGIHTAVGLILRHTSGRMRRAMEAVRAEIESGSPLADALAADPAVFPDAARGFVAAGEARGALPQVLAELAAAHELRLGIRRRLARATIYPLVLLTLAFFVLPLSKLVTDGAAGYLRASLLPWLGVLLGVAVIAVGVPRVLRALLAPRTLSRLRRGLPLLGRLATTRARLAFARQLAASLRAGLDAFASLSLAARATGDPEFEARMEPAARRVRAGATLEDGLSATALFDDQFLLAVAGGEAAGRLDETLEQQARLLQDGLMHRLEVLFQAAAVAILLAVYAVVGWRLYVEYGRLLHGGGADMDKLMQELGPDALDGEKQLPPELR